MIRLRHAVCAVALCFLPFAAQARNADFTMAQMLDYPFTDNLVSAKHGGSVAWVRNLGGVRNVWVAKSPDYTPHQVTQYTADDGQEITQIAFSPDGSHLVYVRGGDHDANWPAAGNLAPDPDSSTVQPQVTIWSVSPDGTGAPVKVAEGDEPALSNTSLAFVKDHQVWTASLDGKAKPEKLFFDRGKDTDLHWSPDGSRLAFVSERDDHAFIGVFTSKEQPLLYLAPSTYSDRSPHWSPDGTQIAFARTPGDGGPPRPILTQTPTQWSIWVADATTGQGHMVWQSPDTLLGSYPETAGQDNLHWADGGRLIFLADLDNWPHLYSVPANGGQPLLLTRGDYMVEDVSETPDRRFMVYSANTGTTKDDGDRRHVFKVPVDRAEPVALTSGAASEWTPVVPDSGHVAFVTAGVQDPPSMGLVSLDGKDRHGLKAGSLPSDYPLGQLVTPKYVSFKAADGWTIHGQLFRAAGASGKQPGVIFVHGGPPRQMMLGWHYMDYYSNSYAVNQYLANHGITVLSVNYRLGIGYGHAFHHPDHAGPTGASEYQDVLAGAHYLQSLPDVDSSRIGIWGGSYGGYLTAMGLARNSDIFKTGVDMHGVHDWSRDLAEWFGVGKDKRYEKGDFEQAMKVAWDSSPDSSIDKWRSPVLLIQGDDDRNVHFQQTIDLATRLQDRHLPYEELVIPNEIHGFLRHISWQRADEATVAWFARQFGTGK